MQHATELARGGKALQRKSKSATDHDDSMCICFVTVSPRLRRELQQRNDTIRNMEKLALPPIKFYSLRELLGDLLSFAKLDKVSESCNFIEYVRVREKQTGRSIGIDVKEAENEIGGVVLGEFTFRCALYPVLHS